MSVYKMLDRVFVTLPSGDLIPTILSTEPESRMVPKTNGQSGVWKNDYADGVQLAPDGITVYPQSGINLAFVKPRPDAIDALDINPETGEVISNEVSIPGPLKFLFNRHQTTLAARQANGGGTEAKVIEEAVAEVSE